MNPRLRARVIAEWRGLPEPPVRPDRTISVADGVAKLMDSLGLSHRLKEEEILRAWEEVVGSFIAAHSRPLRLQEGVLTVSVLQPTMHYELDRVWRHKLLRKLKDRFGARVVRDLRFRIG